MIAAGAAACASETSLAQAPPLLKTVATIRLATVNGRIDHLAYEPGSRRLFVAALGNNTVEVVDASANALHRSLPGFHEPQGIAIVPDVPAVAVANGETGTLQMLDTRTFATRWTTRVGGDADNVRYDPVAKRLYVAAQGGLYAVDPTSGHVGGRIAIDGHPESFQLESNGTRAYANLPGLVSSAVVSADARTASVVGRWSSFGCSGNYPMALDESTSRLFIGCRRPARLVMLDTASGMNVSSVDTVGDTDDLFYDAARRRVYVIGGDGAVDVLSRQADRLQRISRIETRAGARTGLWVAALNRLYVAVPARNGQAAEVRVLEAVD